MQLASLLVKYKSGDYYLIHHNWKSIRIDCESLPTGIFLSSTSLKVNEIESIEIFNTNSEIELRRRLEELRRDGPHISSQISYPTVPVIIVIQE